MTERNTGARALSAFAALFNAVVFLLVLNSVLGYFFRTGGGNMAVRGATCFIFFTIDSNILAAIACLFSIPVHLRNFKAGRTGLPTALRVFKFVGTTAVAVTFFTVMLFLGPTMGYDAMFVRSSFYLHLVCPILCMVLLPVFENGSKMPFAFTFTGVAPTAVYAAVYMIMVVVIGPEKGGWADFYGFNIGGFWYISFAVMIAVTYLLALGIYALCTAFCPEEDGGRKKDKAYESKKEKKTEACSR